MIVFAALVPHTPLLLPTINKEQLAKVEKTRQALASLAEELYAARPDTIVILSSHGTIFEHAFSLNLHQEYTINLSEFGDLSAYRSYQPDLRTIDRLQRRIRHQHIPFSLHSNDQLDYGSAVPLLLLTEHLANVQIIPLSTSGLSPKEHFQFGTHLKDTLTNESKRIALIAAGDLSHTLTTYSPGGFAKEGAEFDALIQECLAGGNTAGLLTMDPANIEQAKECSYLPLLMLLGVLEKTHHRPMIHSYEAPFGVGYLVAHFHLP